MMLTRLTLFILICNCLYNCSSDNDVTQFVVGEDFTSSNVRIIRIDTMRVELSTFKFDSIVTSGTNRLLFGQYNDAYLGKVTAIPYFELSAYSYSISSDAILDSVALILKYDNYFYNDTTQVMHLNVHQLTGFVRPKESSFYNTSHIDYVETPIVTKSFYPKPNSDSLHVSIPYSFGNTLFESIKDDITNTDELLQEIKGLTLRPDEADNGAIIGFSNLSSATYLRFYYRLPDEFDEQQTYDLYITTNSGIPKYFNNIQSDVTGLNLAELNDQDTNLTSQENNHQSYLQFGAGYVTRINFPSIRTLYNIEGEGTVLSATLRLKPKRFSYNDNLKLTDSLELYYVDQNNNATEQVYNSLGALYAKIVKSEDEYDDLYYEIPVLEYIDRKLIQAPLIDDALIMFSPDFNKSVNRIIFNDRFEEKGAQLILTYAIYDAN